MDRDEVVQVVDEVAEHQDEVVEVVQAEMEDHRCSLCPRTHRDIARMPEPPNLETAATSTLHCGHQVHTHCMIHTLYISRTRAVCVECNLTIIPHTNIEFYRQHLYEDFGDNDGERTNITNLWDNDENFRTEVKAYKKLLGKESTASIPYRRDLLIIKNRFKENTLASVAMIKDQQRQARDEYKGLASLKEYRKNIMKAEKCFRGIKNQWNTSRWNLRYLNDIEGAPKFPTRSYRYRWGIRCSYLFRVRL